MVYLQFLLVWPHAGCLCIAQVLLGSISRCLWHIASMEFQFFLKLYQFHYLGP